MNNLDRKTKRRLDYLCTKISYFNHRVFDKDWSVEKELERIKSWSELSDNGKLYKEMVELFIKHNFTSNEAWDYWARNYFAQQRRSAIYNAKPIRVRKDNKDTINYGNYPGWYPHNRIRKPKKARKTAWKRFYKLFPHLNPENKNERVC